VAVWIAADADMASARASSGGYRGWRASPRPAVSPATSVRSAAEPRPSVTVGVQAQAPPSALGSFARNVGAFAAGGLLGRMLFGITPARSAVGLAEIVLLGVAAYLAFGFLRQRRKAEPALAAAESPAAVAVPAVITGPPLSFDRAALTDSARAMYAGIHSAFVMQDMGMFRNRLTPELYARLQAGCDRLRRAKQSKHVEKITIERAAVSEAWRKNGHEYARVRLAGSLVEYTDAGARGTALAGAAAPPRDFKEHWTFTRPSGSRAWRLAAIQTA
jgi:predicted lipid-binding transport protein (Tim44 family)